MMTYFLVGLYLVAIVLANYIVSIFGPAASIMTAFVLIGLIVTTRDRLHDAWQKHLRRNMGALILGGSAISLLLGGGVTRIAIASGVAFLVSETVDAALYHFLRDRGWYQRVNGSNAASSLVDSILFPWIAFGGLMPFITLGQWGAKMFGGAIWSWVLRPRIMILIPFFWASSLSAQSISVGLGEYHTSETTQEVAEAVVLFPSIKGFTPNAIISWDLHGNGEPVLLPQIGYDLPFSDFPVITGIDMGASAGPWDNYHHWEPHLSTRLIAFIKGDLKVIGIMSWQPWNEWNRAVVVKIDYTVW